ncbi:MAG: 50S ribosomal protein L35, partial [Bryobacteraceae bacterium]|nr:50S ribosomal protein L35 [Bryobacteraceae bacterium]
MITGFPCLTNTFSALIVSASTTMPKQKTHKGVKKRFRLTATGKV